MAVKVKTSERLNNVDAEAVATLVQRIQANPADAQTTWRADVQWAGGFRSEARVRDFPPIPSDEPPVLGGTDGAPNPVEQLLGALGSCLAVGYAANASLEGIEIFDLRIELEGDVDLRTFLGLAEGNAGYEGLRVKVHLDTDAPRDQVAALHDRVVRTSPVGHTLSRAVPVAVDLA